MICKYGVGAHCNAPLQIKICILSAETTLIPYMEKSCMLCPHLFWVMSIPVFILIYSISAVTLIILLPFAYLGSGGVVRTVVAGWSHLVFISMGKRLRVQGRHHVQKDQRYILLANHSSLFDILAITAFYPGVSWFGREHLLRIPVFGQFLKMVNYVPMKASDLRNTKDMIAELTTRTEGHTVAIFPEGTRTLDGSLNKFRKGFLHVLKATDLSILPVTLNGFYRLKPKNRFYINFRSRLGVVVHQPISPEEFAGVGDMEIIDRIRGVIESAYLPKLKK